VKCEEITGLMDAYVDGELDPVTSQRIEQHLCECPNCQEAYEAQTALARAISQGAPYYRAPAELRQWIQSSLREAIGAHATTNRARESDTRSPSPAGQRRGLFEVSWNWLGLAAAAIVSAAITVSALLPRILGPSAEELLATQLIAGQVRSLMANHLTDVASSDQHTVKPWLDAKLDFAVPVADLSAEGFPLIGGRLDYLDKHSVAALVYQRRKHFINLFIWPIESGTSRGTKTISRHGYHLLHWTDQDFNYWAVSDVNEKDLQTLKQLFEAQAAHR
jgi:mycothiol system anti-sigma-R factor